MPEGGGVEEGGEKGDSKYRYTHQTRILKKKKRRRVLSLMF